MKCPVGIYTSEDVNNKLSTDLLRDFYQTFRLAQFETAIQLPLFTRLANQHHALGNAALLPEAIQIADRAVDKLMPPVRHAGTDATTRSDRETSFRAMCT